MEKVLYNRVNKKVLVIERDKRERRGEGYRSFEFDLHFIGGMFTFITAFSLDRKWA